MDCNPSTTDRYSAGIPHRIAVLCLNTRKDCEDSQLRSLSLRLVRLHTSGVLGLRTSRVAYAASCFALTIVQTWRSEQTRRSG
ncbi:hypothetical protein SKAU_G00057170 [Synaphobranchus kaupii]|uniref:Uncharacterized protein n=1 Tax=Synaphobranchus kaupii TaxID=118154 RepID=A0A9Q1JAD6_SYNKA|nr:hypothetical protein SKAU_G00057170 [Synaphobranchus kaupii]